MRTVLRSLAELSMTAGLVLAMFVGYLSWGTGEYTHRQQGDLHSELERRWNATQTRKLAASGPRRGREAAVPVAEAGQAYALIRVPKFGSSYRYAVVEGVGTADLRKGPGHYPGTAGPGQVGNMAIAGHRTTYGGPFERNGELARGDEILIDTAATTFVYRVTHRIVVRPGRTDVTAPVPGKPGRRPKKAMLTLTTCHPKFSAAYRLVVFAELAGRRARTAAA
ncbi:class E sortase [Actinomadura livida]|uniref:Class E sortase n=1 Tax=Actinomadura livida TaxID=79909 RepID=A0A7W7I8X7_9ACTN|nr:MULTISPECIES: class E sortase [Actinomadura]MBB4772635.1 sortase A [Actinomadura catellatispora]GGU11771.1 class E sortase [Actinomadura livida]